MAANRSNTNRPINRLIDDVIDREGLTPPPCYEHRREILIEVDKDSRLESVADEIIRYGAWLVRKTWDARLQRQKLAEAYRSDEPVEPHYYRTPPGLSKSLIGDFETYD